jgi:uncharacterized protein (DUF1810 family)
VPSADDPFDLARAADPAEPVFTAVLDRYFDGEPDPVTLRLLGGSAASG